MVAVNRHSVFFLAINSNIMVIRHKSQIAACCKFSGPLEKCYIMENIFEINFQLQLLVLMRELLYQLTPSPSVTVNSQL